MACSDFAVAVTDLRRGVIAVWFRERRKNWTDADKSRAADDYFTAQSEADRLGAAALGAKFRLLLLLNDPALRELIDDAFEQIDVLLTAASKTELEKLDSKFEAHMSRFVVVAASLLTVDVQ